MAAFTDYETHDALGLAALVARGEITPEEVLEAAVERVDARDGIVNAVTNRLYDLGRQAIADGLPTGRSGGCRISSRTSAPPSRAARPRGAAGSSRTSCQRKTASTSSG